MYIHRKIRIYITSNHDLKWWRNHHLWWFNQKMIKHGDVISTCGDLTIKNGAIMEYEWEYHWILWGYLPVSSNLASWEIELNGGVSSATLDDTGGYPRIKGNIGKRRHFNVKSLVSSFDIFFLDQSPWEDGRCGLLFQCHMLVCLNSSKHWVVGLGTANSTSVLSISKYWVINCICL